MKYIQKCLAILILGLLSANVLAVKIYECVDEAGNKTFRDSCPSGTISTNEKKFYTGAKEPDGPNVSISLYSVPGCEACDVVRNVLNKYGARFTEKDVNTNIELQQELQKKSGGAGTLSVPTVIIGEKVIVGYNKSELTRTLEEEGFNQEGTVSNKPPETESPENTEPFPIPDEPPATVETNTDTGVEDATL